MAQSLSNTSERHDRIEVVFFHRKPRICSYSLEYHFEDVRNLLAKHIDARIRIAPFFSNGLFRRLGILLDAWLRRGRINHVTGDISFLPLALPGARTILTIPDCGDVQSPQGVRGWLLKKIWFTWPAAKSAIVTTISEASRQDILEITRCDQHKVVVVPVAVSPVFRYSPKPQLGKPPRILQVGTSANKNLLRVIEAIQGFDCILAIIGQLTLEQQRALLDFQVRYENFVGISVEDVAKQYQQCDLLVFASFFEGFGMPIVEAQSVGRPVITSNRASMPEVAGEAACMVDPENVSEIRNAVASVLSNCDYRQQLVELGLVNARRFDRQIIANQYLALYREISNRDALREQA